MEKEMTNFATAFRHLRIQSNLTQKDIAKVCGHNSVQTISNMENGLSFLPKDQLRMICKKYKWNYRHLASLIVEEKAKKLEEEWLG